MNNPTPFCNNKAKIKTFVLGADPTNPSSKKFRMFLR